MGSINEVQPETIRTDTADGPLSPRMPWRLSATAIDRYRLCPRQALWSVTGVARAQRRDPALVMGTAVHRALQKLWGVRPELRSEAVAHRCLRSVWRRAVGDAFESREAEGFYGETALAMLTSFCSVFDTTGRAVACERSVKARLPNGVEIYGRVDRVDPSHPGDYREVGGCMVMPRAIDVIDYKTGRYIIDSLDLPDESAAQVYLVAAGAQFNRPVRRVRYVYVAAGVESRWEPEDEDVEAVRSGLIRITSAMVADRVFEPAPGDHCARCEFAHLCPEAGRVELDQLEVPDGLGF